jgi:trimethylamine---corrinoid protein Co-methyltransferase
MNCTALNNQQIQRIHEASLAILARTGVITPHPEILSRFADAGASVPVGEQRVRIPSDVVMRLLATAGREFTLYGRDLSKAARFGVGEMNFNGSAGQAFWIDELGSNRRYTTMDDVAAASRFADALEHINIAGAMADPHNVPASYRCVEVAATMLRNTTKPLTFWFYDRASAKYLIDLMIAVRGDEKRASEYPLCYPFLEPISPLRFPFDGIDLLFETARLNLPVPVGPMAQMGLSAPATIAGTMALENAEILAGICITQLVRPGTPVCYGGICHAFDMRSTQVIFGGPEQAIFGVAMTQMGKSYGFPVYINSGLIDSKRGDAQAGLEVGVALSLGAAAGADIFAHFGIAGADQGASLEILLLQDEMISFIKRALRPIDIDDDLLGLDVIEEIGPGGTFIDHEHTVSHFRQQLWFPKLLDREYYQVWLDSGAESMEDRTKRRTREILAAHKPEPIDEALDREIERIVEAAKRELE